MVARQHIQNFKFQKKHTTTVLGASQTVPNEAFTVKEILERFTRGVDPMLTRIGDYDNEVTGNELDEDVFVTNPFRTIDDLTDLEQAQQFLSHAQQRTKELKAKVQQLLREAEKPEKDKNEESQ